MIYTNKDGYYDPTAGQAISELNRAAKVERVQRAHENNQNLQGFSVEGAGRQQKVSKIVRIIKELCELNGYKIEGRITLVDIKSGEKFICLGTKWSKRGYSYYTFLSRFFNFIFIFCSVTVTTLF